MLSCLQLMRLNATRHFLPLSLLRAWAHRSYSSLPPLELAQSVRASFLLVTSSPWACSERIVLLLHWLLFCMQFINSNKLFYSLSDVSQSFVSGTLSTRFLEPSTNQSKWFLVNALRTCSTFLYSSHRLVQYQRQSHTAHSRTLNARVILWDNADIETYKWHMNG